MLGFCIFILWDFGNCYHKMVYLLHFLPNLLEILDSKINPPYWRFF